MPPPPQKKSKKSTNEIQVKIYRLYPSLVTTITHIRIPCYPIHRTIAHIGVPYVRESTSNTNRIRSASFLAWSRQQRWLSGTILASAVLASIGFWVRISARTPILRNITTGEVSQEGFAQELVSPPATSRYIGSVRIVSEAPLVRPNGC
jgi:hypothetical protein